MTTLEEKKKKNIYIHWANSQIAIFQDSTVLKLSFWWWIKHNSSPSYRTGAFLASQRKAEFKGFQIQSTQITNSIQILSAPSEEYYHYLTRCSEKKIKKNQYLQTNHHLVLHQSRGRGSGRVTPPGSCPHGSTAPLLPPPRGWSAGERGNVGGELTFASFCLLVNLKSANVKVNTVIHRREGTQCSSIIWWNFLMILCFN